LAGWLIVYSTLNQQEEERTMSDNLRRYRAIRNALTQAYPPSPTGNFARHLQTLAALISGIVGSKSTQLPTLATKVPDGTQPESRVKRFARWIDNERILEEMYFLPYAEILLALWYSPGCKIIVLSTAYVNISTFQHPEKRV
jgi:hypothetical protein